VSLYDNRGGNASNSFQQTSSVCFLHLLVIFYYMNLTLKKVNIVLILLQDAWRCEICGAKSGKGFGKLTFVHIN
jgi:hypothetical protein